MSKYGDTIGKLSLNELHKEFANTVDSMQGMAATRNTNERAVKLSKLIILNNAIRERVNNAN